MTETAQAPFHTLSEVAQATGLSRGVIARWAREGRIKAFKTSPGRASHYRVTRQEVERLLSEGPLPLEEPC